MKSGPKLFPLKYTQMAITLLRKPKKQLLGERIKTLLSFWAIKFP